MKYSVSNFGDIPYDQKIDLQLVVAPKDNSYGCKDLENPSNLKTKKFVWFVKRGNLFIS